MPVLCRCFFFACHTERSRSRLYRERLSRRTPANSRPPQPPTPFSLQTPSLPLAFAPVLRRERGASAPRIMPIDSEGFSPGPDATEGAAAWIWECVLASPSPHRSACDRARDCLPYPPFRTMLETLSLERRENANAAEKHARYAGRIEHDTHFPVRRRPNRPEGHCRRPQMAQGRVFPSAAKPHRTKATKGPTLATANRPKPQSRKGPRSRGP